MTDTTKLIQRTYIIINIQEPPGLFIHGIRDWVKSVMTGRSVEGFVKRSLFDGIQCLTVRITGNVSTLDAVYNALQSDNWKVSKHNEIVCPYSEFVHGQFRIIQSDRGALSGPLSDSMHDNKSGSISSSVKSGQSGSNSAKSGGK